MTQDDLYNEHDPEDEQGSDYGQPAQENRNIRRLREKAEKLPQVEKELDQARRELAMVKAGLDLNSPTGRLFQDAYAARGGEATVEAVKAAAAEYGLIAPEQPSEEELSQQEALQRLSTAGQAATAPGAATSVISPADFSTWDHSKKRLFLREHPHAAEALKRGQTVPAIPGF